MVRVRRASRVVLRIVSFAFLAVFSLFAGSSEARAQEPSPTTQASPTPEAPQSPQAAQAPQAPQSPQAPQGDPEQKSHNEEIVSRDLLRLFRCV